MTQRGTASWFLPAAAGGIIILTLLGLSMPQYTDVQFDDPIVRWALPLSLGVVAVTSLVVNRFIVLPPILRGEFKPRNMPTIGAAQISPPTYAQIESTALGLACAFSVSDAIYGLVTAIELDNGFWALPFGGLGLVSLAVLVPYTNAQLERLHRERTSRGEA